MIKSFRFLAFFGAIFIIFVTNAQQLAFPTAEGAGCYTTGGRGGVVYEVTNLSDAGVGSLRYGIESVSGARTIVFCVSGTIELTKDLTIAVGNITIAGQTAPGDGICIKNKALVVPSTCLTAKTELTSYSFQVNADNVIIRYIRFRPGDDLNNAVGANLDSITFENDGFWGRYRSNIILDHCSASWAIDEVASFYDNHNFTMQWCLLGESLYDSYHSKGQHGYCGIWGGYGATFHHNLLADNTSRNPRFCGARYHTTTASAEKVDLVNNVIYNWAGNTAYGGEGGQQNLINNYYKPGPATKKKGGVQLYRLVNPSVSTSPKVDSISKWYLAGNTMEGYPAVTSNNALGAGFQPQYTDSVIGLWARVAKPVVCPGVLSIQTAQEAYNDVLNYAGASLARDTVDKRIVYQARTATATTGGTFGTNYGIIDSPSKVGGWPTLNSTTAPADTDHDGMPDFWETQMGLNINLATDRNGDIDGDGYTNLEEYLNALADGTVSTGIKSIVNATGYKLEIFPNPVSSSSVIRFVNNKRQKITVEIFDMNGKSKYSIANSIFPAGENTVNLTLTSLNPGIYFVNIRMEALTLTRKIIVLANSL